MSETSGDRTKRVFCNHLKNNPWEYQYSVFYGSIEAASRKALEDSKLLRKLLGRKFPSQAFLYRLCLKMVPLKLLDESETRHYSPSTRGIIMPYHTMFTNKKIALDELQAVLSKKLKSIRVEGKRLSTGRTDRYCNTVMREKPHNLKRIFGDRKINRFSLINEAALAE